jgi:hypothetical protein
MSSNQNQKGFTLGLLAATVGFAGTEPSMISSLSLSLSLSLAFLLTCLSLPGYLLYRSTSNSKNSPCSGEEEKASSTLSSTISAMFSSL